MRYQSVIFACLFLFGCAESTTDQTFDIASAEVDASNEDVADSSRHSDAALTSDIVPDLDIIPDVPSDTWAYDVDTSTEDIATAQDVPDATVEDASDVDGDTTPDVSSDTVVPDADASTEGDVNPLDASPDGGVTEQDSAADTTEPWQDVSDSSSADSETSSDGTDGASWDIAADADDAIDVEEVSSDALVSSDGSELPDSDGMDTGPTETCLTVEESCGAHASCVDTEEGPSCVCDDGFIDDSGSCVVAAVGTLTFELSVDVSVKGACIPLEIAATGSSLSFAPISLEVTHGSVHGDSNCVTSLPKTFLGGALFIRPDGGGDLQLIANAPGHSEGELSLAVADDHFGDDRRPERTLIIYNTNASGALEVASHYADSRGVGPERLCPVSLPRGNYATPKDLLGARAAIVEDCFCPLLGDSAPLPCDTSTLTELLPELPITHLVVTRGIPARMVQTGWPTDFENPAFDFYLSVLLAQDLPLFEAGQTGGHTLAYPYTQDGFTFSSVDIQPALHGYFAISRVEAITAERTMALIDRTLDAEDHGFEGHVLSETEPDAGKLWVPGRWMTSSFAPECDAYLSHEPFVFGAPESTWPFELCRWGTTGSTAAGSAKQLMPGLNNTTVAEPINVGLFVGNEPFSEPYDNNHSAFYSYENMLRWRKTSQPCTPECEDLMGEDAVAACRENSTDYFKELNTDCVGLAKGFMGQQLRSWPVGYYGFTPEGWQVSGGGPTDRTGSEIRDDGAFVDEAFTDPFYLRFGKASPEALNEDLCLRENGEVEPCLERVAVAIRRYQNLTEPLPVLGARTLTLRVRYRNQGHPGSSLAVRALANFENTTLLTPDGELPVIDLSEGHTTWQTASFQVVVDGAVHAELSRVGVYLDGNLGRQIRGFLDLDGIEVIDDATNTALLTGDAMSFALTRYRTNHMGESAAVAIDRMGAIAYWGSSSHHLTGGWSLYPNRVVTMLITGRTLGEATAFSGAKAGLVYGDPNYLGYAVSISQPAGLSLMRDQAVKVWPNTPAEKWPRLSVHNGMAHTETLSWTLDACMVSSNPASCSTEDWQPILRGKGAVRQHRLDTDAVYAVSGPEPVLLRLRAWRPGDVTQHLSDYAYLEILEEDWVLDDGCAGDVDGNGVVNQSDYAIVKPLLPCDDSALVYDVDEDGDVDTADFIAAVLDLTALESAHFDMNGDGVVDANDVNLFQLLISANHCGQQGEGSTAAFDVDGDGVFTAQDAQAIEDAFGTEECPCDSPFCAP